MIKDLSKQTISSEFISHWVSYTSGFGPDQVKQVIVTFDTISSSALGCTYQGAKMDMNVC